MKGKRGKNGGIKTISRLLCYIKPHISVLIITFILSFVVVALTLYIPILFGRAVDMITGEGNVDFTGVEHLLFEMAVVVIVTAVAQWVINVLNNRMTYNIVRDMRRDAFDKIMKLPLSYMDSHLNGATVSRVISDVDTFSDGLLMGVSQLLTGVLTIAGTLFFMIYINWKIACIVVFLTPLSMLVSKFIASRTFRMFRLQAEAREEQTAFCEEIISSQKIVKAFCMEDECRDKFAKTNARLEKTSVSAIFFSSLVNPSTRFLNSIVYAAVALAGAFSSIGGYISIGGLTSFLGYANQYTKPFNEISGVITEFQNALACASRIFELIDTPSESPDKEGAISLVNVTGNVDIDNIEFSYSDDTELIKNFNLHILPGQKVAIVGPTGCGKTTIINLLMRFYDVKKGSIKIDGIDIRDMTRKGLRESFGMVLQDTWLKTGTIRDNIALGCTEATDDEVIAAAKAVRAHSFISRLPEGYDTYVENDGIMLSQGEKQLISIARVMMSLPPMLILDEATSSIDIRTEIKVQEAFDKLTAGRTSFIVAHRLSTIKNADVIIVMKDGRIIETGNHRELLEKEGFYTQLYKSQFIHDNS